MKNRSFWGGILTATGAVMGIAGHFWLFLQWYQVGMHTQSAEPGCEILLKYVHPAMADFGLLGSVLFAVSAYGFFSQKKWAFPMAVIGIVLALLGSWFINVPYMAAGLPPVYFILFWPYVIFYFLLMVFVGGVSWKRTLLGLLTGVAYIFCFMNGISSTSRIITHGDPIFALVQRLHFVAMLSWAVVTVGVLLQPKEWMRVLGLVAGTVELTVGIPLAYVTAQQLGRFSLFALAPIACLLLLVLLVWPRLWERLTEAQDSPAGKRYATPLPA